VFDLQRLAEQGVVLEVEHAQTQIKASTPVRVDLEQLVGAERRALNRRAGGTVRGNREVRIVRLSWIHLVVQIGFVRFRIQFSAHVRTGFCSGSASCLLAVTFLRPRF